MKALDRCLLDFQQYSVLFGLISVCSCANSPFTYVVASRSEKVTKKVFSENNPVSSPPPTQVSSELLLRGQGHDSILSGKSEVQLFFLLGSDILGEMRRLIL
jgi:hypothetical protein